MPCQLIVTEAFKDHGAFILKVKMSKKSQRKNTPVGLPAPEEEGNVILENVTVYQLT
jgi:hypothetical protein